MTSLLLCVQCWPSRLCYGGRSLGSPASRRIVSTVASWTAAACTAGVATNREAGFSSCLCAGKPFLDEVQQDRVFQVRQGSEDDAQEEGAVDLHVGEDREGRRGQDHHHLRLSVRWSQVSCKQETIHFNSKMLSGMWRSRQSSSSCR